MEIVLDTNALVYAAKYKIDIIKSVREKFGLIGVYVPNVVMDELKNLAKSADKATDRDAAWLAYQIVKQKKILELKLSGGADDAILEYAMQNKASVLTNDIAFRMRLKSAGLKVYAIRQQKLIEEA